MSRRPGVAAAVAWQHVVQTPAASLFAVELGHGPPLLFLHGVTASAFVWRPVMDRLSPYYRTAAFDALDRRVARGARTFADEGEVTSYLARRYPRLPPDAAARRARHGYAPDAAGRLRPLADAGAMRATCTGLRADLAPALSGLRGPALLVRGADSAFVPAAAFEAARALRPGLRAVVVPDADHYVPEERPEQVASIIGEFGAEVFEGNR